MRRRALDKSTIPTIPYCIRPSSNRTDTSSSSEYLRVQRCDCDPTLHCPATDAHIRPAAGYVEHSCLRHDLGVQRWPGSPITPMTTRCHLGDGGRATAKYSIECEARSGHRRRKAARSRPALDLMAGVHWVHMHTLCALNRKNNCGGHEVALRFAWGFTTARG
jgi:hypothetical protein